MIQQCKATTKDAYRLFHEGAKALALMEHRGIRVDTEYLDSAIEKVTNKIDEFDTELKDTDVWRVWTKKFASPNMASNDQMAAVLFGPEIGLTPSGHMTATLKHKMDEAALEKIDHPFCRLLLRKKKYEKIRGTYLYGIRREVVEGFLHPSYNLHLARTYRSSCSDPNFQNLPIRNKMMAELIRQMFIARKGNRRIVEVDFNMIEVYNAYFYHKDPVMKKYLTELDGQGNPKHDMHRDQAIELFKIKKGQVDKKSTRDSSKNQFVFPQFYGSVWFQCAPAIWERMKRQRFTYLTNNGETEVLVRDHLKKHGIRKLGNCDPDFVRRNDGPEPGTFSAHVRDCERKLWKRFSTYADWKKEWYAEYLKTGSFKSFTGFEWEGILKRNDVTNYPVQSAAFHCLLKCLIEIQKRFSRAKLKSYIVGQIHDSLIIDMLVDETDKVLEIVKEVMTVWIREQWSWITIPLRIEVEAAPVGRSWHEKEHIAI